MPKKLIKRWMPRHETVRDHPHLNKLFGTLLHDPNLLHLNRRSVSGAFFVGLFWAFVPVPLQMIFAAAFAIYFRVNLPISVGLVWITNPLTMPPIFFFCYKLGALILDRPVIQHTFELTWDWISTELGLIWQPFLLGCFIVSVGSSLLGGFGIRLLWRINIVRQWEARKRRMRINNNQM